MTEVSILTSTAAMVYLDRLKDVTRGRTTFRDSLTNVTTLMVADALSRLGDPDKVLFVPIIRGGLGMVDGAVAAAPNAKVGHIGVYRDPTTHDVVEYYAKVPYLDDVVPILLDPMVATGGTAYAAASSLVEIGYRAIHVATVVASASAIEVLAQQGCVDTVFTCELDPGSPGVGTLANGLGDAGARLYGTP